MSGIEQYDKTLERERLIEAVENGTMTREAAEDRARELGLVSLLPEHPPEDFDPMAQPRWTLLMALVWVLGRNSLAIRNSWNAFTTTQYRWEREGGLIGPLRVKKRQPQWAHQIHPGRVGDYMFASSPGRSFPVSWARLRSALSGGQVVAWGRDLRQGDLADVAEIPCANWDALQLGEMPKSAASALPSLPELPWTPRLGFPAREVGEDMLHFGNGAPVYVSVMVEREGLIAAFPAIHGDDIPEGQATSIDPVKQITDATEHDETPAEYKKRIRMQAITETFPEGVPKSMKVGVRNHTLDKAVEALDKTLGLTDEREWRRLVNLAFPKAAKAAE